MIRPEVQGIRCVGIVYVLLFHFFMDVFPNGYLGVDIFFVVSGFLIASILIKDGTKVGVDKVKTFYYRRIKRIFPLFYLVTTASFILAQMFLSRAWTKETEDSSFYTVTFMKNLHLIDKWGARQEDITAVPITDIYAHDWSLSVEIQFYFLAPVIYAAAMYFTSFRKRLAVLLLVFWLSFTYYVFGPRYDTWFLMPAKLWQFMLGGMAALMVMKRKEDEECLEKAPTVSSWGKYAGYIIFCIYVLLGLPMKLSPGLQFNTPRVAVSVATAVMLYMKSPESPGLLSHPFLVYIGDVSYTLYLVHWPFVVICGTETVQAKTAAICFSIIFTVFLFHCFESVYLRWNFKKTVALMLGLILLDRVVFFIFTELPDIGEGLKQKFINVDPDDVAAWKTNLDWLNSPLGSELTCKHNRSTADMKEFEGPWGLCQYPKSNGTLNILVIGDAMAISQVEMIRNISNGKYREFNLLTDKALEVTYDPYRSLYFGSDRQEIALRIVNQQKPDIIFVVTGYHIAQRLPPSGDLASDPIVQDSHRIMKELQAVAKKIYIQAPMPMVTSNYLGYFVDSLELQRDRKWMNFDKKMADRIGYFANQRLLAMDCKKCEIYDLLPSFQAGNAYLGFNSTTLESYYGNEVTLTRAGLKKIRHVYENLISKL